MKTTLWLAWRELAARRGAFVAGMALVAGGVALCATLELWAQARDAEVKGRLELMGPSLLVVPARTDVPALAAFEPAASFTSDEVERASRLARAREATVHGRLLGRTPVDGRMVGVLGVEAAEASIPPGDIVLGAELARRLQAEVGQRLEVGGRKRSVMAIRPFAGGAEDLAVLMHLEEARALLDRPSGVDALAILAPPTADVPALAAALAAQGEATVLRTERGSDEEVAIASGFEALRRAVYLVTAVLGALFVGTWTHRNAADRRLEMGTLAAAGGAPAFLAMLLILRALVVATAGAGMGIGLAILLAGLQGPAGPALTGAAAPLAGVMAVAVGVAGVGALPAAVRVAVTEHVHVLQR